MHFCVLFEFLISECTSRRHFNEELLDNCYFFSFLAQRPHARASLLYFSLLAHAKNMG